MRRIVFFVLVGLLLQVAAARAAVITRTYAFEAINLTILVGSLPPPTSPVIGQVTVTFDTAVTVTDIATGITLDGLNIALASPISFSYAAPSGLLQIGGTEAGSTGTNTWSDDFVLRIRNAHTNSPSLLLFEYVAGVNGSAWSTDTGTVALVAAVPEPASFALLGAGLAGLGLVRRRRNT